MPLNFRLSVSIALKKNSTDLSIRDINAVNHIHKILDRVTVILQNSHHVHHYITFTKKTVIYFANGNPSTYKVILAVANKILVI